MNTQNFRIFKLVSGEMVIGRRAETPHSLTSPFLLHHGQNGFGLIPMFPWCDPTKDTIATFAVSSVMCEANTSDPSHLELIKSYERATSRIQLP